MCSKKISLPKSGNTDIVQNNVGHSMLQSDWNIDIIQNSVGRSMLRGDGGVWQGGSFRGVVTWSALGSGVWIYMVLVLGDFFYSMNVPWTEISASCFAQLHKYDVRTSSPAQYYIKCTYQCLLQLDLNNIGSISTAFSRSDGINYIG